MDRYLIVTVDRYPEGYHMMNNHRKPLQREDAINVATMLARSDRKTKFGIVKLEATIKVRTPEPPVDVIWLTE